MPAVASNGLLLLHVPPVVAEFKVVEVPGQIFVFPVMAAGTALTVMVLLTLQPPVSVYVIFKVFADTPDTTPEEALTVAAEILPLVQVPPNGVEVNAAVAPAQRLEAPVIGDGLGFKNMVAAPTIVVVQPVGPVPTTV